MVRPDDKIGPYTLKQEIGRGNFGVVWLAEKRTTIATTRFALKLARDEDVDLEAFRQEADIWVQASYHPNVLQIIEADVYDGQAVIVSEYAPDGSLTNWLWQHGGQAPSVETAAEMALQILAGLEHLHEQRIVHRDIKPSNILLKCETPLLADFGIACLLRTDYYSQAPKGTPSYMAPEAFRGKCDEQTDVWSVGVILYQMLAGRLPYGGSNYHALRDAINNSELPPLPAFIPESTRRVVERALERDASRRYQSAAEMRRELRAVWHEILLSYLLTTLENEPPVEAARPLPAPEQSQPAPPDPLARNEPPHTSHSPVVESRASDWSMRTVVLVLLIAVAANAALLIFVAPASPYDAQQVSPDGKMLAGVRDGKVILLNLETKKPSTLAQYDASDTIKLLRFSSDGKTLAGARGDVIVLWDDVKTGAFPHDLSCHTGSVKSLVFGFDGERPNEHMLASVYDNIIILWDVKTREPLRTFPWHSGLPIGTVTFSPDGRMLTSAGVNNESAYNAVADNVVAKTIILWDVKTGAPLKIFGGFNGVIDRVEFVNAKTLRVVMNDNIYEQRDIGP